MKKVKSLQQEQKKGDGGLDEGGGSKDVMVKSDSMWDIYSRIDPIGLYDW